MTDLQPYNNDGIEIFINTTTGESFASVSGYARMADRDRTTISKRVSRGSFEVKTAEVKTGVGLRVSELINMTTVLQWLVQDNPSMINPLINKVEELTGTRLPVPLFKSPQKSKIKFPEKKVQKRLSNLINGKIEVQCKTGAIDILTDTEIIEVKKAKDWKHAIGQVLVYQLEYPDHKARIHLYEDCSNEFKQMVRSFASQLNVTVSFEDERDLGLSPSGFGVDSLNK